MFKAFSRIALAAVITTAPLALSPSTAAAQQHRVEKKTVNPRPEAKAEYKAMNARHSTKQKGAKLKKSTIKVKPTLTTATETTKDASSSSSVSARK